MLSSKYRFHGRSSLKFLFGKGKIARTKSLSIRFAFNPRRTDTRVAVVISKKVLKSAPKRNRVRRRIFEFIRTNWDSVKPGYDIVLSVYDPTFLILDSKSLQKELTDSLKSAGVWETK